MARHGPLRIKNFFLIIAAIFCFFLLVSTSAYLYLAKKYNVSFSSAIIWNLPSELELYAEAPMLAHSYPRVIAGNVEPAGIWVNRLLGDKAEELKDLGVNTVTIMPSYEYLQGKAELKNPGVVMRDESTKALHIWQIIRAKKLGFAVFLTPNFVGRSGQIFEVPLETFLEDSRRIALEWAKIAETFNVEYFSPQGEFDLEISLNYFGNDWEKRNDAMKVANDWHRSLLPDLRRVFSGQVAYKYTLESENLDASGYDIVVVDVGPWNDKIDEFRENMRRRLEIARVSAERAGANWLVGEFWAPHGGSTFGVPSGIDIELYGKNIKQEDLYTVFFEEYKKASLQKPALGFMFNSFLMPGTDIAGRPSESLVREFFRTL